MIAEDVNNVDGLQNKEALIKSSLQKAATMRLKSSMRIGSERTLTIDDRKTSFKE